MNDPAPIFGRGAWVGIALLLGLFAGSGITWVLVRHGHAAKPPAMVYQIVPPTGGGEPPEESLPTSVELHAADGAAARNGLDGIHPIETVEKTAEPPLLPEIRLSNDRLLRNHPKAEGCLTNALAALAAFTKKGFDLRETVWDGEITLDEGKAVSCQLFKGNEYCFCVGTDAKGAKLSLQLYDRDGTPTEAEQSQQALADGATAMACLKCRQTGTYFVIVKLEEAAQEKVPWGMLSAYR